MSTQRKRDHSNAPTEACSHCISSSVVLVRGYPSSRSKEQVSSRLIESQTRTCPCQPAVTTVVRSRDWQAPPKIVWSPCLGSIAWIVATAHALLRDTQHVVAAGITVWMFVTPVFWVPSPEVVPGIAEWLPWLRLNPMHDCLYAWRYALMSGEPSFAFEQAPTAAVLRFAAWSLASFGLGAFVLCAARRRFADEV